jgi:hypothetical protein
MSNKTKSDKNSNSTEEKVGNHDELTSTDSRDEVVLNNSTLNRNDVFLGRGGNLWKKEGNARLREICFSFMPQYDNGPKLDKPQLAQSIVHKIKAMNPPGRFLKKKRKSPEPSSLNSFTLEEMWVEVSDDVAIEKVSQVFRDIRRLPKSPDGRRKKRTMESDEQKGEEKRTKMKNNTIMSSSFCSSTTVPQNNFTDRNDATNVFDAQGFYAAPHGYHEWWSHNGCPPQGKSCTHPPHMIEPLHPLRQHHSNIQNLDCYNSFYDKNHALYQQVRTPKTGLSMVQEDYMMSSFNRQQPPYCYSFPVEARPHPHSMAELRNNYFHDYQNENHFNSINNFQVTGQTKSPMPPQTTLSTNARYQNSYLNIKYDDDSGFAPRQSLSWNFPDNKQS